MLNITSGRIARPQKLVIYGSEGIGKTSLAAQCPDPLFIDTEGGSSHLDVRRLPKPENWDQLISMIETPRPIWRLSVISSTRSVSKPNVLSSTVITIPKGIREPSVQWIALPAVVCLPGILTRSWT